VYEGIPLYEDSTLQPYSVVYAPIGRNLMRPYERRRTGPLAGTTGSRPPSFPIETTGERELAAFAGELRSAPTGAEPGVVPESLPLVGTGAGSGRFPQRDATADVQLPSTIDQPPLSELARATRTATREAAAKDRSDSSRAVESIPKPLSNGGIWVPFNGSRWYNAGDPVPFDPDQFTVVGNYRGFPVYRKRGGSNRAIYIPAVDGGLLAQYQRR
jgi:hypothetical protein